MNDKWTTGQLLEHFDNDLVDTHAPFEMRGGGVVQRCDMCAEIRRRLAPRTVTPEWVEKWADTMCASEEDLLMMLSELGYEVTP